VPITNSLAFLFTVLGEWWAEGKVITRGAYSVPLGWWVCGEAKLVYDRIRRMTGQWLASPFVVRRVSC